MIGAPRKSADEVLRERGCLRRSYEVSAVGRELLLQLAALSRGGTEGELPTLDEVVGQLHAIVQNMQPVRDVDGSVLRANLWYGPECVALAKAIAAESRRMRGELPSAIIDAALSEVRYVPGPVRLDSVPDRDGQPNFNPVVMGPLAPMPSPHGMDTLPQIEGLHDPATSRGDGFISSPAAHPPAIEPAIHSEGVAPPTGTGIAPHVAPHSSDALAADDPDLAITQEVERTGPAGLPPAHTRSPDLMAMEAALYGGGGIEGSQVTAGPDETGSGAQVVVTQELPGPDLRAVRPGGTPGEPPPRPPIAILVDWVRGRLKRRGSSGGRGHPGGRTGPLSSRIVLSLVVVLAGLGMIATGIWGGTGSPSAPTAQTAQAEAALPPAGQIGDGQQKARVIDMLGPGGGDLPASAQPDATGDAVNEVRSPPPPVPAMAERVEAELRPEGSSPPGDKINGDDAATDQEVGQVPRRVRPPASTEAAPGAPVSLNRQPFDLIEPTTPSIDRHSPQSAASVNLPPPDAVAGGGKPSPSGSPAEAGPDPGQLAALVAEIKQLRTEVKELKEVRRTEPGAVGLKNDVPAPAQNPKRGLGVEGRAAMGAIQRDASGAAYVSIIHGERLIDIAQRTGVPVAQLKAWNPWLVAVEPQLQLGRGAVWVSAPHSSSQGRVGP